MALGCLHVSVACLNLRRNSTPAAGSPPLLAWAKIRAFNAFLKTRTGGSKTERQKMKRRAGENSLLSLEMFKENVKEVCGY